MPLQNNSISIKQKQKFYNNQINNLDNSFAGILWIEPSLESNLALMNKLDYLFDGLLFKNYKNDIFIQNQLNVFISKHFKQSFFLIQMSNIVDNKKSFTKFLESTKNELKEKKILLIDNNLKQNLIDLQELANNYCFKFHY